MPKRPLKNIPASVHQRLLNLARETKRPFNELLQYFAIERFLFRFSRSEYADQYVLKGADLESVLKDAETSAKVFQECAVTLPPDDSSTPEAQKTFLKAFKACGLKADSKNLKPIFDGFKID